MNQQRPRLGLATWLLALFAAACAAPKPAEPRTVTRVAPAVADPSGVTVREISNLYAPDEALRDVLSGELKYLGTGKWPGVERSRACAFRNDRVLIVNVYCTLIEQPAFRLEVYSPERGRVRLYAEANGPVSARNRGDYFTFMTESGPPPEHNTPLRPVALNMSYDELRSYEQRRYDARLPGCFGGEQLNKPVGGCVGAVAVGETQWAARNRAFLDHPNDDWYRVIKRMRTLAAHYGKNREEHE